MESVLYQILTENMDFHGACDEQLRAMPHYTVTNTRYQYACQQMNTLKGQERKLFLEYESANNAMSALLEMAAAITGFRLCLSLLTEAFRGPCV